MACKMFKDITSYLVRSGKAYPTRPIRQGLSGKASAKFGCMVLSGWALIQGLSKVFFSFPFNLGGRVPPPLLVPTDLQHIVKETTSIFQKIHENSVKSNQNTMYIRIAIFYLDS